MAACQPSVSKPQAEYHDKVTYCVHKYVIESDGYAIPVCSQYPLSAQNLRHLDDQFEYTCFLYRKFIESKGYTIPERTTLDLDVYFTTYEHINDPDYFPRKDKDLKIVGRYINDRADIFVTDRVFTSRGYVDFPHELAHWFNDMLDVSTKKENEQLAVEFERYYETETR